jgi:hypothetical protein
MAGGLKITREAFCNTRTKTVKDVHEALKSWLKL